MQRIYVLSVLVKNHAGVLSRVAGLFSRRSYNISSLTVGETEDEGISRMTIELFGDEYVLAQIKNQLAKLVEVIQITELGEKSSIYRELMLVKVSADEVTRPQIVEIANVFRAKVVDIAQQSVILEITGDTNKLEAFLQMLEPYTIREIARTGITGLQRGNTELINKINEED